MTSQAGGLGLQWDSLRANQVKNLKLIYQYEEVLVSFDGGGGVCGLDGLRERQR